MKDISFKAIALAIVVSFLLDTIGGAAGVIIFAGGVSKEILARLAGQPDFLLYILAVSLLSMVVGGYISGKLGKLDPYKNGLVFGLIGFASGIVLADFDPFWFDSIKLLLLIPASLLGVYLAVGKKKGSLL